LNYPERPESLLMILTWIAGLKCHIIRQDKQIFVSNLTMRRFGVS